MHNHNQNTPPTAPQGNPPSALKAAFVQSRAQGNIDLVLPVLLAAKLYIVTAGAETGDDYFLVKSPNKERFCVTVAEQLESLQQISWPKIPVSGAELLKRLPAGIEIVVTYPDGGDYLTREQLQWYRDQIG
ncbi:hypothetical protein IGB42_01885 [Andreprevotia sp. IGB-42]|uniref:hypothetical protein n=1 Tax=Andreprevotia sp. IGB-42 TaxID=2497473 RepID=UPI0013574A2E|nr:hypothetical protein [Andreprevotia sp. IGB-42]KAF0813534.1 hypothetical protein IGB42_01885 [Andreprevotia sp. IGB-42]